MSNYDDYNSDNIYNDPKKWGLVPITDEDRAGPYEFDIFSAWYAPKDKRPGVFFATDSGCSCPTPFSNFVERSDLNWTNRVEEVMSAIDRWNHGMTEDNDYNEVRHNASSLKGKIRNYFDENSI